MRNPKSIAEHVTDGTYRKDRHAQRLEESVKILTEIPQAPKGFDKKHREKWGEVCRKVYDLGILSESDLDSLQSYVEWWFVMRAAWDDIQKNGLTFVTDKGTIARNPSILTMNEATQRCQMIADKFAWSPKARMTIKTGKQEAEKVDPLDNLN